MPFQFAPPPAQQLFHYYTVVKTKDLNTYYDYNPFRWLIKMDEPKLHEKFDTYVVFVSQGQLDYERHARELAQQHGFPLYRTQ